MTPTLSSSNQGPGSAKHVSQLLFAKIDEAIAEADGLLPFDRFMELALYAPGLGYYVAGARKFGPGGDFVTAPDISPVFGQCVAAQCAETLGRLGGGDLLEFGPGSGVLAAQILARLDVLGALPERYLILELSPELQARQSELIRAKVPRLAERCLWLSELPQGFKGVVIANEVLDAMPVHRFRISPEGDIHEVFVTLTEGKLGEVEASARSPDLNASIRALQQTGLATAPGYASEINLRLGPWLSALAERVTAGLVLLIDYGYPRSAYYQPDRHMGTLLCHYQHQVHHDPYRHLGLQDITAHVDFTAIAEAGVATGFGLAGFTTQAHFLIGCGIDHLLAESPDPLATALSAKQLLLPTSMGERFKVVGLTKGVTGPWCGFTIRDLSARL